MQNAAGIITLTKHPQPLDTTAAACGLQVAGAPDPIDIAADALKPFLGSRPCDKHMRRRMVHVVLEVVGAVTSGAALGDQSPEGGAASRKALAACDKPTPAMIEAGVDVLWASGAVEGALDSDELLVVEIFEAMNLACRG